MSTPTSKVEREETCPSCLGSGLECCSRCAEEGLVHCGAYSCDECDEDGVVECSDCDGTGGPVDVEVHEDGTHGRIAPPPRPT